MSHQPDSPWNDEIFAEMKRLAAKGLSQRDIYRELNLKYGKSFTRNAVIGKMNREGVETVRKRGQQSLKPTLAGNKRKPGPRAVMAGKPSRIASMNGFHPIASPPLAPEPEPVAIEPFAFTEGIPFMEIGEGQCRWPNDGLVFDRTFRFCGGKTSRRP